VARKGEILTKIDVNAGKALRAWMDRNFGFSHSEVARILQIENPGRIQEILDGKRNTKLFVRRIVKSLYKGDYLAIMNFATTDLGRDWLEEEALMEDMGKWDEHDRQLFIEARRQQRLIARKKKLPELLKAMKNLNK